MAEIKNPSYFDIEPSLDQTSDTGSRYFGGSNLNDHPFIKGYYQVFFELPATIFGDSDVASTHAQILTATVNSFTPPADTNFNTVDIIGQGGVGSSFVSGNAQIARDFSLTFNEKYKSPVWNILSKWTHSIIDPYFGVSTVLQDTGFISSAYKGRAMVVETQPVKLDATVNDDKIKQNIIRIFYCDGVFPINFTNSSVHDANNQSNDMVQINASFRFDGYPLTHANKDTLELAVKYLKNAKLYEKITKYYDDLYKPE